MHRTRAASARARASREGRRDESTVNNSGSKLKIRLTGALDGACWARGQWGGWLVVGTRAEVGQPCAPCTPLQAIAS
jgi:hypothetical protein